MYLNVYKCYWYSNILHHRCKHKIFCRAFGPTLSGLQIWVLSSETGNTITDDKKYGDETKELNVFLITDRVVE